MVHVLYGSVSAKLTTTGSQNWHQDEGSGGIAGDPEEYDNFGMALASGDFNNDNKDDLAVGVPNEDVSGYWSCGAVNVIYGLSGSWDGLDELNNVCWHRGDAGIEEGLSDRDGFGAALGSSCSSSSYYEVDHTAYGVQTSVPFPFNLFD